MQTKFLQRGYTLIELLLAMAVGVGVLGATYSSYLIVSKQHQRMAAAAEVMDVGIPSIELVSRDLRSAGYQAMDANMESINGPIADPILIVDSGNACCDSVEIIYDVDLNTRLRISYYVAARANPVRNALYTTVETWNGAAWDLTTPESLVSDYIEDFQMVGSEFDTGGNPTLVDVSMVFRNKKALLRNTVNYSKPAYEAGNFALTANDTYHRDEFFTTVNVRNLQDITF